MIISERIYIDLNHETVYTGILEKLTYDNPEYYSKMNMGLPVFRIPKKIEVYKYDKEKKILAIPRGEALAVKQFIGHNTYEFRHPDHPIKLQYINTDFDLDEYQEGAVAAMTNGKRQGIIHAVTSAGKSLMILKTIVEIGQKAVVVVPQKLLMKQLLEDIDKYIRDEHGNKITPGIMGGGKITDGPIVIAIDKTMAKNLDRFREAFGLAILDECHKAPAHTVFDVCNGLNTRYRFGFSGTLKRKDGKQFLIYSTFGEVIYTISKDQLIDKGRIVPVKLTVIDSETKFNWNQVVEGLVEQGDKNPTQKARLLQEKTIANDRQRNSLILKHVASLEGKTIVLCRYVDPCYELAQRFRDEYGIETGVITGKNAKEQEASYEAMKHGDLQVIFATVQCMSTGISIADLKHLVLISPIFTNELLLHQIRGRLMRKAEGKEFGHMHFVFDPYIFPVSKLNRFSNIILNK